MESFIATLGWWNLIGSVMMFFFLNERFGSMVLVESTGIFKGPFRLDYWGKLWLAWAAGANLFFGIVHILTVHYKFYPLMIWIVWNDVIIYVTFILLSVWGIRAGRMGKGAFSVFIVFGIWLSWSLYSLYSYYC